jgi:predicted RNA-binding Zn ribbon-like protein
MTATANTARSGLEKAARFSLCGGHPVLDLVNTLDNRFRADGPTELLPNYQAVLAFMQQTELLDRAAVLTLTATADAEAVAAAVRGLRETAAIVLYAVAEGTTPPPAAVQQLARHAQEAHQHQELLWCSTDDTSKFVWRWRSAAAAALPLWALALQTSALLTSDELRRLRTCQCETCRWLFLDTSKNHRRRWCDMKVCGNRMKARRYQARRM